MSMEYFYENYFFGRTYHFLRFPTLSKEYSHFVERSRGLWQLHFACPNEQFDDKNFFFVTFQFLYPYRLMSEQFLALCRKISRQLSDDCILRVHRKFSHDKAFIEKKYFSFPEKEPEKLLLFVNISSVGLEKLQSRCPS